PGPGRRAARAVLLRADDRGRSADHHAAADGGRAHDPRLRVSYLEELFGLDGATAVVTGGTSGLGAACARALGRAGAKVVVSGRDRERGERVVAEIAAAGGSGELELAELGDADDLGAFADRVRERHGPVDILV